MRALLFAFCLMPVPAFADCLTPADIPNGVVINFNNNDSTMIRPIGDGVFLVDEYYDNASLTRRFESYLGIYVLSLVDLGKTGDPDPGTASRRTFSVDLGKLPVPVPDLPGWDGDVNWFEGDQPPVRERFRISFHASDPLELDDCSYQAVRTTNVNYNRINGNQNIAYNIYLPELGFGYITAARTNDGPLIAATAINIRPLP